jgi:hypothetical protein
MNGSLQKIDHTALKVNQITIVVLNILAFVLAAPLLAAFVTAVMLLGTARRAPGFGFLYQYLLQPRGWVKPEVLLDHAEPHRFAQGFGSLVMLAGSLAFWLGAPTVGWGLVWLVTALAALNAFGGFCVGCFVYYWLARLRLPGFIKNPPQGTFPGMRPRLNGEG